jgi:hypothetical protein
MATDIKSVIYTDDAGRQYNIGLSAAVFAQAGAGGAPKVGGADYTGTPALAPMPKNLRPRVARVSAAGKKRRVICLTPTAGLYTGTDTTIDLTDGGGVTATYSRYEKTAENYRFARDPTG